MGSPTVYVVWFENMGYIVNQYIPIKTHDTHDVIQKTILKLRAITTWHYKPQMTWNVHGIFPVPTLKLKPLWVEQAWERRSDKNDNIHKNLKWITSHLPQNVEITLEFCHLFTADGMEFTNPAHNHSQQLQSVHTWNWKKISWVKNFKKSHYLTLSMAVNLDMTRLTDWNSDFLTVIFPILVWGIISRLASPGPSQCRLIYHDSNVVRVPWSFEKHTYQSDVHF